MPLCDANADGSMLCVEGKKHFGWWLLHRMMEKSGGVRTRAAKEADVDHKTMLGLYEQEQPDFRSSEIPYKIAKYLGITVGDLQERWRSEPVAPPPEERRGAHLRRPTRPEPAELVRHHDLTRPLDLDDRTVKVLREYITQHGEQRLRQLVTKGMQEAR